MRFRGIDEGVTGPQAWELPSRFARQETPRPGADFFSSVTGVPRCARIGDAEGGGWILPSARPGIPPAPGLARGEGADAPCGLMPSSAPAWGRTSTRRRNTNPRSHRARGSASPGGGWHGNASSRACFSRNHSRRPLHRTCKGAGAPRCPPCEDIPRIPCSWGGHS